MIIDSNVSYNSYIKLIFNFYGFWSYICPCCNAKNSFIRHAKYSRNLCIVNGETFEIVEFTVLRLYCKSCKSTHAILPAGTIPYSFYSVLCVLMVLKNFYVEENRTLDISDKFQISQQIIYQFISRYLACLNSCITFLRIYLSADIEANSQKNKIFLIINSNFNSLDFFKEYFSYTNKIFAMTRRRNILSRRLFIGM